MKHIYEIIENLHLKNYNTEITREEFEKVFYKTRESVRFSFNGWDGKSYDGESRNAKVIRTRMEGFEDMRFVKVGKNLFYLDEDRSILEKATGEYHVEAGWLIGVERRTEKH